MTAALYQQLAADALEAVRFSMAPYNWMLDEPDSGPELRRTYLRVLETVWQAARLDHLNALWCDSAEPVPTTERERAYARCNRSDHLGDQCRPHRHGRP